MTRPLYNIEIKAFHCSVELWLNDILVFNQFEEKGSIWIDWPINHYILGKGIQSFELRLIPYRDQATLSERVEAEVGVHAIDAITEERLEVLERMPIKLDNVEALPLFVHKGIFNAIVPHELEGYKNSVDLSKEKKEDLFTELIKWNHKLLNILKTSDLAEYNKIFKKRTEEFDKSHYMPSIADTADSFHSQSKYLIAIPNDAYKLFICAQGKLASVRLPYELPGFTYEPSVKDEETIGFSFNMYFHRRAKGMPLEVIR